MNYLKNDVYFAADRFKVYINSIIHSWSKTLTALGFTLIPIFGFLDYFTMPKELLQEFGIYRFLNTLILVAQFFVIRYTKPSRYSFLHGYFASGFTSFIIAEMTVSLGGFNSSYYQGLNLVIIGVNLLIPWHTKHSAANGSITIFIYLILNIISGQEFDKRILANNLFFMTATVIIAVSINYVRHNLIRQEFQLRRELKEARDALWGEMEIAKKIQTALLPDNTSITGYEVYAKMIPAEEVGGDYYDIIETPNNETWLAIGDVSGHGVESGLIMMMTHTSIYSLINQNKNSKPSEVLNKVNYVIKENIRRLNVQRYMTLSILKLESNCFFHSGKHQDILIFRSKTGKVESVSSKGTWIGIIDNMKEYLTNEKVEIEKDDIILLFTDGLTEAQNRKEIMYDQNRLINMFEQNSKKPVKELVENIISDVQNYQNRQIDDITLLACKKL
ncbi:MAG: PP2C family protein-serine/threonine phosphatase [Spirochaetia bacterium]|nr:PP2C family protein-serine/threonine phosphatase [Spirochaetia bacterium]